MSDIVFIAFVLKKLNYPNAKIKYCQNIFFNATKNAFLMKDDVAQKISV
jgi:hypothetical protein